MTATEIVPVSGTAGTWTILGDPSQGAVSAKEQGEKLPSLPLHESPLGEEGTNVTIGAADASWVALMVDFASEALT